MFYNSVLLGMAKKSFLKTAVAFKAYSFPFLLFSAQRNFVGKLSLSEYRATGISLLFSEQKELHAK